MNTVCAILLLSVGVASAGRALDQAQVVEIGPNTTQTSFYQFLGALDLFSGSNTTSVGRGFVLDSNSTTLPGSSAAVLVSQFESLSNDNSGTQGVSLSSVEGSVNTTDSILDVNSFILSNGNSSAFARSQQVGSVDLTSIFSNSESSFLIDGQSVDGGFNSFALVQGYGDARASEGSSFSSSRLCSGNQCP